MKKVTNLFFVMIFVFSMVGCVGSTAVKPSENSQRFDYKSDDFPYITIDYIPEGFFHRSDDIFDISKDQFSGVNSIDYIVRINNGPGGILEPYYRMYIHYSYADDGRNYGEYMVSVDVFDNKENKFESLEYIRDSLNGYWKIYYYRTVYRSMYGSFVDELYLVMLPTDEDIVGEITLAAHYYYYDSSDAKTLESLKQDASELADGISKSALDKAAFDKRFQ